MSEKEQEAEPPSYGDAKAHEAAQETNAPTMTTTTAPVVDEAQPQVQAQTNVQVVTQQYMVYVLLKLNTRLKRHHRP